MCGRKKFSEIFHNTTLLALAKNFPGENFPLYGMLFMKNSTTWFSMTFIRICMLVGNISSSSAGYVTILVTILEALKEETILNVTELDAQ